MAMPKGYRHTSEARERMVVAQRTRFPDVRTRLMQSLEQTENSDICWEWQGTIRSDGYGFMSVNSRHVMAHRLSYETFVGPIPAGLQIDHLCRNRRCVNPRHLEPVTQRENLMRGETITAQASQQTHCKAGHAFDEANTYRHKGERKCRACRREADRRRRGARR